MCIRDRYWKVDLNILVHAKVGGAIIATQSTVTIIKSRFEGNSAEIGGAIFANDGSKITIINSTFKDNYAVCATDLAETCFQIGGVLHSESVFISTSSLNHINQSQVIVVDSEFSSNNALYGGVMSLFNTEVSFTSSKFFNNSAGVFCGVNQEQAVTNETVVCLNKTEDGSAQWSGGVLFLAHSSTADIDRSQFYYNTAFSDGGVLYVTIQSAVTINNSEFWNNTVLDGSGGVIYLVNISKAAITNKSWFYKNAAYNSGAGGVLAAFMQSSVTIHDSDFWSNWGQFAGGVFYVHDVIMTIQSSLTMLYTIKEVS